MSLFSRLSSFRKSKSGEDRSSMSGSPNNEWEVEEIAEDKPTLQKVRLKLQADANELVISPDFRRSYTPCISVRKIELCTVSGIHAVELRNRKEHKDDFWNELNVPRTVYKQVLQQAQGPQPLSVLVVQTTRSSSALNCLENERLYYKLIEEGHSYFRPRAHVFLCSARDLELIRLQLSGVFSALNHRVLTHRLGERESLTPLSVYCERFGRGDFDATLHSWLLREHNLLKLRFELSGVMCERMQDPPLRSVFNWLQMLRIGYPRLDFVAFLKLVEKSVQLSADSPVPFATFERLYFDVFLDPYVSELRSALRKLDVTVDIPAAATSESTDSNETPVEVSANLSLLNVLFAKSNSLMDPERASTVTQNMDQPLNAYWIASSHNTYLTRHQTPGHSTCDAYRHALLMGARCIEMDVYDGDDSPVILHGMGIATLSNKIRLDTVLRVVKKYAFVTSDYPVIISIENHCVQQLGKMANLFREILGEQLIDKRLSDADKLQLPSPNRLRNRFVLKASYRRKHHAEKDKDKDKDKEKEKENASPTGKLNGSQNLSFSEDEEASRDREGSVGVGEAVTWGKMQLEDKRVRLAAQLTSSAETEWLWVLDSEQHRLYLQRHEAHKRRPEILLEPNEAMRSFGWFHPDLSREDAEKLLLANRTLGNGAFLVRPCRNGRKTPYALSFLYENSVLHARIEMAFKSEQVDGDKLTLPRYCIDGLSSRFSALSVPLLISHYRRNQLDLKLYHAPLTEPVSVWLHEQVTREQAISLLQHYYSDGLFLLRRSNRPKDTVIVGGEQQSCTTAWSISFCANGAVHHVRVCQLADSSCVVGACHFESLENVVRHYLEQPLVAGQILLEPVTWRMLQTARSTLEMHKSRSASDMERYLSREDSCCMDYVCEPYDSLKDGTLFPYFTASVNLIREPVREILQHKGSSQRPLYAVDLCKCELEQMSCHSETTDCCFVLKEVQSDNVKATKRRRNSDSLFGVKRSRSRSSLDTGVKMACARSDSNHDVCLFEMMRALQKSNAAETSSMKKRDSMKTHGASEFFELIVYCKSLGSSGSFSKTYPADRMFSMQAGYTGWSSRQCYEMPEASLHVGSANSRQVLRFTCTNLMRTYPHWRQITSGNFNPVAYWNVGTQMVALNYQTAGKPMMVNSGRFAENGGCGYVLKPSYMRTIDENYFDPNDLQKAARFCKPITVDLTVVAAHRVCRGQPGFGLLSVFVEVEVFGVPCDCKVKRTRAVPNGFFPVWNDRIKLPIVNRDLALLLFSVYDTECLEESDSENKSEKDSKAKRTLIGYACYPLSAMREGLRSVHLRPLHGPPAAVSALLVHVLIRESSS